ncbi:cobaltochelatase subunit CobN [Brasilonema bromeliae]|uniref:Cobaltochelatase subunit CobN n=1 Tax=Brasilonema bromeliae SPC951 TaxID=385972 RepID=A0ABX1P3C9_9CYAN|nr:cobaltochelatase subunit CobN [Brasilonema bromeliae]NMG18155.1 cobaltochelatase subunit CobN [Brasilonema bromeliae SPC951]
MHRTNATSGGWNPQSENIIFLEQTPAPIVFLTSADTDIQTLAAAVPKLPSTFPGLRVVNLLQLQYQISIDSYAEKVLESASVIILRLLGGRSYWAYGLEVVQEIVERNGTTLIVMPGDDAIDPDFISQSTLPLSTVNQVWQYFNEGGVENFLHALHFICDTCFSTFFNPPSPQVVPRVGLYEWEREQGTLNRERLTGNRERLTGNRERLTGNREKNNSLTRSLPESVTSKVGILFYRAHYLAGNTKVIDALCNALAKQNLTPVPIFVSSLRDVDVQEELCEFFQPKDTPQIALLLNTTSFSLARLETETPQIDLWQKLDVPVLQVILSGGSIEQWRVEFQGLSPRDMAMNVALPEVDGRIISRAVSFKTVQSRNSSLETDVVVYEPVGDRIEFVTSLAANWVRLRSKPPQERRVALILANYPNRDGRLANGVGLDTPASCVEILKALQLAGYQVENLPDTGDELISCLTAGVTNDSEGRELRPVLQCVSLAEYEEFFSSLPDAVQKGIGDRWGGVFETNRPSGSPVPHRDGSRQDGGWTHQGAKDAKEEREEDFNFPPSFPVPGIQLGNIFVGVQPARGYDVDPSLSYHASDLEPTHDYLAFYYWVRQCFGADAVVDVGKHGNLEWLPGKSVALSSECYPEVALGALPHLYPFIVNDPGEGSQAKRRAQAVIVDHLTPPLTRAELYGCLHELENLIDEYYEAQSLDPSRLPMIGDRIRELVVKENLFLDLELKQKAKGIKRKEEFSVSSFDFSVLPSLDGYLCELKESQIRDGLHVFGQCPQGRQLRDLIVAIARHPNRHHIGLTRALAQDFGLDFDPLTTDFSTGLSVQDIQILANKTQHPCRTVGDAVEFLEEQAAKLVEELQIPNFDFPTPNSSLPTVLDWIRTTLLPSLLQTQQEITNLLHGLDGGYVPSAPAGAPTRGRPEVLPTGKNFYSVDIRAIPTETAWDVGRKAAEALIERYVQEEGEYPKTLGLSVWGTATMRTGGDDIAQALALLGVQPVWDGAARRVVDFEILPLSVLGRPRVDVTLRISGFFRDAFPNLIDLFDSAVQAVAALDETPEENPLAAQVRQETEYWTQLGLSLPDARVRSRYRIFGSKPGAYGAGLQGLIEGQNWTDDQDLARAYINWSCYAYSCPPAAKVSTAAGQDNLEFGIRNSKLEVSPSSPSSVQQGRSAPEAFEMRLREMQIVLHNQDNREHDLLDSDDYYQFQGGLTAAIRAVQGKNPQTYFGDHSIPAKPQVRQLKEEIARVYRSRVVNPKWIAGMMRHGYKGAFEMAATVDYLFAYDATAQCVEDYMYQGITEAYLFDPVVSEFVYQKNPYALRDMAERLLEAHQRGLWEDVNTQTLEHLRNIVHQAEAAIEEK